MKRSSMTRCPTTTSSCSRPDVARRGCEPVGGIAPSASCTTRRVSTRETTSRRSSADATTPSSTWTRRVRSTRSSPRRPESPERRRRTRGAGEPEVSRARCRAPATMRPDDEIRHDVERELASDPSIDERRIAVAVLDGIVTLTGEVGSLWERWNAQRVVERVKGVRGVANELDVRLTRERTDTDIARAAAQALEWNVAVPSQRVQVKVENGWLVLTGEVESGYQRRAAEDAVRGL